MPPPALNVGTIRPVEFELAPRTLEVMTRRNRQQLSWRMIELPSVGVQAEFLLLGLR